MVFKDNERSFLSSTTAFSLLTRSTTVVKYYHGGFDITSAQNVETAYAAAVPRVVRIYKRFGQQHIDKGEGEDKLRGGGLED